MAKQTRAARALPATAPRLRTPARALADSLPDALAAAACALAWALPQRFGFDLVGYAAPLFFIQLPLALIALEGGVLRLEERDMSRAMKASFIVVPILFCLLLAPLLLGWPALLATAALALPMLFDVLTGRVDRSAPVRGAWMAFSSGDGKRSTSFGGIRSEFSVAGLGGRAARWRVEAGHDQVMAALTLAGWCLALLVMAVAKDEPGAITAEVLAGSAWPGSPLGALVPAHAALAAGLALFAARFLLQFEGVAWHGRDEPPAPPPSFEDDPVLREIVDKLEGREPGRRRRPR